MHYALSILHTQFSMKHTRDHNGGNSIGLIRTADTRMGGHVISVLRTLLRLKDALPSAKFDIIGLFLTGKFKVSLPIEVTSRTASE